MPPRYHSRVKRLDRGIAIAFLGAFLAAALLFTLAVVFSGVVPSLQYIDDPDPRLAARWLLWQFPSFLVQAMPIAVVMAVLVTIGRLVRDRELLAMRAGGIPARRPVHLLMVVGCFLALGAMAAQQWWIPYAAEQVAQTWWRLTTDRPAVHRLVGRSWFVGSGDLRFQAVEEERLVDVRFVRREEGVIDVLRAPSARFEGRDLVMYDATRIRLNLAALDGRMSPAERLDAFVADHREQPIVRVPTHSTLAGLVARYSQGSYEDGRSLTELWRSATNELRTPFERREDRIRLHRKVVESLANVAIIALAVPLAIRYATSAFLGFGLTLGTALLWYGVIAGGELMARAGLAAPGIVPWAAIVAFLSVGAHTASRLERV